MNITYSKETGELCPKFPRFTKILITTLTFLLVLVSSEAISQAAKPCLAHRWDAGDGWRLNTTTNKWEAVVLSSPNLQPKGIVRCASSAETESGLQQFKGVFHAADNPPELSGGGNLMDCFNQGNQTFGNNVARPTEGEDIVWFNFDIRPLAGTYQFQIVTNESVGWALFYSNKPGPTNGITPGPAYPAGGGLSGDCSDLTYATVSGHGGCGLSGNGWSTITVPSFLKPTNYYLAMWMASPTVTTFPNSMNLVYKSRYGCGGATCALEFLNTNLSCAETGYTVCANYGGSAGKWGIVDNASIKATSYTYTTYKQDGTTVVATGSSTNLSTTPLSFILGTVADDGPVFVKICATYGDGNPYDISLVPDGSYSTGNNYVACTSGGNFKGAGITKQTVTATATPSTLVLKKNIISSVLHAAVSGGSADYSYSWQQLTLQGNTSFTNTNTADATFKILNTDLPLASQYDFKVTVTDNVTGCIVTALVSVLVDISAPPCTITGTPPDCPGGLQQFTGPTDADITAWQWQISEYGQVPTGSNPPADGSTIDGSSTSQTVTVKPGSNCKVAYRLTVTGTAGLTKTTCFKDVMIEDKTAPVLSGQGGPITIECPAIPAFTPPTATDNCDAAPVITFEDKTIPGTCAGNYAITRTWTAKDVCGNISDPVSQTITVLDTKAPVIGNIPADVIAECDNVPVFGNPTVSDDCDPAPTLTYEDSKVPGDCPQNYQLVRTWTAKDACGNTSAPVSQTITVQDTKAPVIGNIPADVTAECDNIPDFGNPTATDNCDATPTLTYVDSKVDGNCPQNYQLVRTWTAKDACGNISAPVSQTITVQDTKAPVIGNIPVDVIAECDNVPDFGNPTASDNCDPAPVLTYEDSKVPGDCPQNYQLVRTWTAKDACGNISAPVSQTITVQDTKAPVIGNIPADVIAECDNVPDFGNPTVSDNCDPAPVLTYVDSKVPGFSKISIGCPQNYQLVRTWTATDACGNTSAPVSQTITVQDTKAPVIGNIPADVIAECDNVPAFGNPTASDNCDPAPVLTYEDSKVPGDCPQNYQLVRTWTATDACGNTSAPVSQTITVQDTKAPVIGNIPADVIAECDNVPEFGNPTVSDNCDPAPVLTYEDSKVPGDCPQNYQLVRTWTAKDACGNISAPVSQTITVQDTKAPVIGNIPADVIAECDNVPDFGNPTVSDNCDPAPVLTYVDSKVPGFSKISIGCPQNYQLVRTWTATDACGNISAPVSQTITVQDTKAPVIGNIPADVIAECDNVPEFGNPTASDNCDPAPVLTYEDSKVPGDCPQNYQLVRTWTAKDACGNISAPVSQTITVQDTKAPVIGNVPADVTAECDNIPDFGNPTATDNCDATPTLTYVDSKVDGNCPQNYQLVRTWTAKDACGNISAPVSQTITVQDTKAPVIGNVPADVIAECDNVPAFGNPTASDNCDPAPVLTYEDSKVPGDCPQNYQLVRTWTAKDACGNISAPVSQTITVQDTKAPVIGNIPADVIAECDNVPEFGNPTASDNCDPAPVLTYEDSKVPGDCPQNYQLVRTWTAKDACGNISAPVSQTITVQDTKAPVIGNVPADVTAECDNIPDFGNPTATDNCDATPTLTYVDSKVDGNCPQNYQLVRTWTAKDACGNISAPVSQTITVQDTKAPVFGNFPADVTAECDNVPEFGTPTATDNCDATPSLTYVDSKVPGSCVQNYKLVRTWTATDDCGNKVSKAQTITVQDTKAPVLTCAANKTLPCGSQVVFTEPTATDNCDPAPGISVVSTTVSGNTTTRTWKATDACGNVSATCSQSITVEDCNHTFPTQTTCCNYVSNTASPQTKICYTVTGNKVSNATPGVFFYYSTLVAPAATFKVDVEQSNNKGSFKLFTPQNTTNVRLFTMDCNNVNATATISGGNATLNVTGATPGVTYIVSVKYDTKSIVGSSTGGGLPTVTYTFRSFTSTGGGGTKTLVPNSTGTMDAVANCTDNTPLPQACTLPAPTIATKLPETPVVNGQLEVTAFPNPAPARGSFNLKIVSPVSGTAVIQYFNVNGSKVQEVKKVVQAHVPETVKFEGSNSITGAILYKVSVEGHSVKGLVMRPN